MTFAPHDTDKMRDLSPTSFGDVFYIVEALTWVERYAVRSDARSASRLALEHYLWGAQGLKSSTENGYWWRPQNLWSDSKMAGMLYVLTEVERWSHPGALGDWIPQALAWLADPGLSRQIGVTESFAQQDRRPRNDRDRIRRHRRSQSHRSRRCLP